jgi:hypothetical protein
MLLLIGYLEGVGRLEGVRCLKREVYTGGSQVAFYAITYM